MSAEASPVPEQRSRISFAIEVFSTIIVAAALIGAAVGCVLYSEWLPHLWPTAWAAFFGLLAGTALAFSSFPRWTSHLAGLIYGVFCVVIIGGSQPEIARVNEWRERAFLMLDKIGAWGREALVNGASRESLPFVLLMAALFWLLGYLAGWYSFRRRRIWLVLLPAGVTLFVNLYYYAGARAMQPFIVVYSIAAVLLLALSHAVEQEETWRLERVRFAASLRPAFILSGLGIAAIAVLFAWQVATLMSSGAVQSWFGRLSQPYQEAMARVNRLFSTLQNPITRPADSYSDSLELGGPRNLTEAPVMDVVASPARYYWRASSYDQYDGRNWRSTLATEIDLSSNAATLPLTPYLARVPVRADFSLQRGTDAVYVPSQPIQAGVPSRAVIENENNRTVELAHLKLNVLLLPGNRYDAVGSMSAARVNDLRVAGEEYPAWLGRYLQVPNTVSARVRALAVEITRNARTPFDKAAAIERWLRKNVSYDEKLEQPPAGVEASDYVLFSTRRAYCTYYSTAMVVMLRSQGIPARMAVGYAQGEPEMSTSDLSIATYHVRQRDSHAWVEVFFPNYGWVEFEPTSSQPEIPRREDLEDGALITPTPIPPTPTPTATTTPEAIATPTPFSGATMPMPTATPQPEGAMSDGVTPTPSAGAAGAPPSPTIAEVLADAWRSLWASGLLWLLLIPLAPLAAVGALRLAESFGLWGLPVVERTYGMLMRWSGWLGVRRRGHTPYEQADDLAQRVPAADAAVRRIVALYVERRFGPPRRARDDAALRAELTTTWRTLCTVLLQAFVKGIMGRGNREK